MSLYLYDPTINTNTQEGYLLKKKSLKKTIKINPTREKLQEKFKTSQRHRGLDSFYWFLLQIFHF